MASLLLQTTSASPFFHFLTNNSQITIPKKGSHRFSVSCQSQDENQKPSSTNSKSGEWPSQVGTAVDRRNVVLGGLFSGAAILGGEPLGFAAPVLPPDLTKCGPSDVPACADSYCCPPLPKAEAVDFQLPPPGPLRERRAAHLVDKDYMEKYSEAVRRMKNLPADDPRNFMQQANVHCAYCNNGYEQVGFPGVKLQVHHSWLFFPFHRFYLYFYEKILGKLIDDPNFALPFWNYDNPNGMKLPDMYNRTDLCIYDPLRDPNHRPPRIIDLEYRGTDPEKPNPDAKQKRLNLYTMYRQMIGNSAAASFLGHPYRAGDSENAASAGSIEKVPHNTVHRWTGRREPHNENMGNFYSAGRDPIFFAHHANVDRLWTIWRTLGESDTYASQRRRDFNDPDWLNAQFLFYDENAQLVRVKVQDCLDPARLGYTYQDVPIPWTNYRPTPQSTRARSKTKEPLVSYDEVDALPARDVFPTTLDREVRVIVPRPKKSRRKKEKDEEEEVLVIEGIEYNSEVYVKFDVHINEEHQGAVGPDNTEFAGSFVSLPHKHRHGRASPRHRSRMRLGIGQLLEDLGAEDDAFVVVTLVPRSGAEHDISVDDIKIEFD